MIKQTNIQFDHNFTGRFHKIDGDEILERFALQVCSSDINNQHHWFQVNDRKWDINRQGYRVNQYERDQHEKRYG